MAKNSNLHTAKAAKNDEFYTQLTDIEKELKYYKDQFKDKVVYCNCDNPNKSEFVRFFRLKFVDYGLKKLIATCITEDNSCGWGYVWDKDINGNGILDEDEVTMVPLKQNGDFASPECIEFLKESDIVVTNPPFSCYSSDTQVLTSNGWKFFKDVDIKTDKIYSLNPDTNEIEIVNAVDFIKSPVNGNLLNFNTRFMDIAVTDNHKMFTYYTNCNGEYKYKGLIEAKDVRKSDLLKIKGFSYFSENKDYFILPATTQKEQYSRKDIDIPAKEIPMNAWLEFFGFWLADGCTHHGNNTQGNPRYIVDIKQSLTNKDYVIQLYKNIGYDCKVHENGGKGNFCVYSKQLWEYLNQFGKSGTKFVPREFLELGKENLMALYKGYTNGDSHNGNNGIILSSKSEQLMSDFQEIILKLFGQIVTVRKVNSIYNNEPYVYYMISQCETKHHNYSKYQTPKTIPYNDYVYCLTLEKNHIMLVKRNGKISWCGNCFRDYIKQLFDYNKKFLVIGNMNAITYKEIFPYIKEGKLRTGKNSVKEFKQPDGTMKKFGNIGWFTNLETHKADNPIQIIERYKGNESKYPHYDNYDAINCDKIADFPIDLPIGAVVGVPISIVCKIADDGYIYFDDCGMNERLQKYGIEKFRKGDDDADLRYTTIGGGQTLLISESLSSVSDREYEYNDGRKLLYRDKWESQICENVYQAYKVIGQLANQTITNTNFGYPFINGHKKYARIIIQKIK